MTIREVLNADWTVSSIDVVVRNEDNRFLCRYLIGKDVKPSKHMRFECETDAGDIYKDNGLKTVLIDRIIQYRQLAKKPNGKEMCVGVLEKEIPKEIIDLEVTSMMPYGTGRSDEMHSYRFECYVDSWCGISGENKQLSLFNMEVMP